MKTEMLTMSDGAKVYLAGFMTAQTPTAVVQFVHGFGEHTGRYTELAERFNAKNIAFVMHDQRGHGKTPGKRGVSPSYDRLLDDVDAVRNRIGELYPDTPVALYGHSMGGNISLNYLISRSQKRHVCAVIGSPWLRLYHPFPAAVMFIASGIGKLSKNMTVTNKLDLRILTHDGELVRKTEEDVAYHGNLSFRLFTQITSRGEYAVKNAGAIKLPALLMCAGDDRIVSTPAVEKMAANAGDNFTLKKYDGLYHELHNELEREQIFSDVYGFISCVFQR
jgi:alpha-beta hydrolase superfamily lysophospholipase